MLRGLYTSATGMMARMGRQAVSDASGPATLGAPGQSGLGTLASGFLEAGNVHLNAEMTNMVQAQWAHQVNLKAMQTIDETTAQALRLRR